MRSDTYVRDALIWGLMSVVVLAIAGLALNLVIARVYGPEVLGTFNLCLALFIVASQLGSFGIHHSVLEAVSKAYGVRPKRVDRAVWTGFLTTLVIACAVTVVAVPVAWILQSLFPRAVDIREAWLLVLPGVFFIPLNKFLLNTLNAARHMRSFAALNSLRFALVLATLGVVYAVDAPPYALTLTLSVPELLLFGPALLASRTALRWRTSVSRTWLSRHLRFGSRSFLSGAILELNTRIDILCLGFFADPRQVGIYSIALLIVEGFGQVIMVARTVINPILAKHIQERSFDQLRRTVRRVIALATSSFLVMALTASALFPFFVELVLADPQYHEALTPLQLLLVGQVVSSGFLSIAMILTMAAKPGFQTLHSAVVLLGNLVFNVILIPVYGIIGAAIATGLSYMLASVALLGIAKRSIGHRII